MSGYPPIPRDPSGAPLPVVWDDGLQSWKVYEGLMPLETKLAAIESKLLALDSKFADGSAKVALSGRIVDDAANRPAADSVDKGTVFWAVDTGEVWVSTGTEWRSLGVA